MTQTAPAPWFSNFDDLPATLETAWGLAARGVADRRSPFHTPSVATVGRAGAPEVRTVVLRGASAADWQLRFHTDVRSGKFVSLSASPGIALHVYDAHLKVQVRFSGTGTIHVADAVADAAWSKTLPMSRVGYAQRLAPGAVVADPQVPSAAVGEDLDFARANFAAVVIQATHIEWLYLRAGGHRRAAFIRDPAGVTSSQWLAP